MTDAEIIETLRKNVRTVDLFHTPKSKKEMDDWLALQARGTPTAGVFAMVGFNYAMDQVRQMIDGTHPGLTPTYDPDRTAVRPSIGE